ncbi:MAG: transglutaminase-like domain-containing protein [Sphingobacteriaceae bacterium]|jgi:regulator of sirC expression with transglutaminase-like and TPR domain|nr:MAG: hypothetical protein E6Q66_06980 [Pedobacter sp.]
MDQKEIKSLIKLLDDPDQEVSRHVEDRILSYGNGIIKYLENAWEQSFDAVLQNRIENLVHKIQFKATKEELQSWISHGSFDLLQGLIIINRYQYPDLDEQRIINQMEVIKRDIWMQMIYEMSPMEKVKLINHVLYTTYGFSGNTTNHKDPQNSYLSQVLETRKGNQVSLAVIYLIIAHKLDIPIYGVNLPQHFILAYMDTDKQHTMEDRIQFYINAFNKGFIFGRDEVDSFLKQLNIKPEKHFYEPCTNQDIIKRVIRNLISAYQNLAAVDKTAELNELLELF